MVSQLNMSSLPDLLTICKLNSEHKIPDWAITGRFFSITRTADELSIVCAQADVPEGIAGEPNWRCLKVEGPLDLGLTGILVALAAPLAEAGISIFAISTFETDYLMVKAENFARAVEVLRRAGHYIRDG